MTALGDVLELQLILFLVMGAGIVLTKLGVFTASGRKCLTDLLIDLILPCNILCSFQIEMSREILLATLWVLGIACGIQAACYLLGKWIFCFAPEAQKKVLQYATMCSNAGFMGNPIIEGLYGAQGLLYGSVYLIPLRFFMWSAGLSCFTKSTPGETVKKLATHPCILAVFLALRSCSRSGRCPSSSTGRSPTSAPARCRSPYSSSGRSSRACACARSSRE